MGVGHATTVTEPTADDLIFMAAALECAKVAGDVGEVPVGAVIVLNGEIIGAAGNYPIASNDPTAHAEIRALRQASGVAGNYRLPDADAYVTLEPCAMCAGAFLHARIRRLFFAAVDPKTGACGSLLNLVSDSRQNHQIDVSSGLLAVEAAELLQAFFRARRK